MINFGIRYLELNQTNFHNVMNAQHISTETGSSRTQFRPTWPALLIAVMIFLGGCELLEQIAGQAGTGRPLTNSEVIEGLKEALVIGSGNAAGSLSQTNGYYNDAMVRIMLPPEADVITQNLSYLPGGEQVVEDIILRINRAAEDAAREAAPVFAGAVRNMTIRDGFEILRGEQDAATQYLRAQTYDQLFDLYQPKIKQSLDKAIVGNISTNEAWDALTTQWNRLAASLAGQVANLSPVDTELDSFLTVKALDGLFLKLAEEEVNIRENPAARVTELLRRVFGYNES